jgi:hypothetical protein
MTFLSQHGKLLISFQLPLPPTCVFLLWVEWNFVTVDALSVAMRAKNIQAIFRSASSSRVVVTAGMLSSDFGTVLAR